MPGSDDLYPPAQYGASWLLLAIGILILLALAATLLIVFTRPRRSITVFGAAPVPHASPDALSQLRVEYLDRICAIEETYRAGNMDPHHANLELSRVVRTFVNEYSGLEAPVLTLDELVARGAAPTLIDAIARHYYPSIFQQGPAVDPSYGAEAARRVVNTWH